LIQTQICEYDKKFILLRILRPSSSIRFPYTTLFRSCVLARIAKWIRGCPPAAAGPVSVAALAPMPASESATRQTAGVRLSVAGQIGRASCRERGWIPVPAGVASQPNEHGYSQRDARH